jgi:short subunit dehydrogenase-like uncharacterized protein
MSARAPILVHGATGFTGGLVCDLLAARGLHYAISGRSRDRLERVRGRIARLGGVPPAELCVVDVTREASVRDAIVERKIVLACAGPFALVGEPVLATCAKLGIHYADTTGEQRFVANAKRAHHRSCEASGACIVPAMAYEIAPADWACHLAAERVGGAPDTIDVFYAGRPAEGSRGGGTTRGTKKSILGVIAEREPVQWIDGELVFERSAERTTSFALPNGRRLTAASFPSPEAIVVPGHTGARNVRTYMAMTESAAKNLHRLRKVAPSLVRATRSIADRIVERTSEGPRGIEREGTFTIVAEATKGNERSRVALTGKDPYGLTAELQVHAAERAISGAITARGVVGPSVAFPPRAAIAALAHTGLSLVEPA